MLKKQQKPILSIVIAIAIIFTFVEGAIFILQVMQRNQNNEMGTRYRDLQVTLELLDVKSCSVGDLHDVYDDFSVAAEKLLEDRINLYLVDEKNTVLIGDYEGYRWVEDSISSYWGEENYFDDVRFMHILAALPDAQVVAVSSAHADKDFLSRMVDYNFIYKNKIYYKIPFEISDGSSYAMVVEKYFTLSGKAVQQMVMLLIIYVSILLVLWIISMCQAISRHDDFRRLLKVAYYDELTGIANQKRFELEVADRLKHSRNRKYAIITIDIMKFKVINDFYGEEIGNEILVGLAQQITKASDRDEFVARQQGDVFLAFWKYSTREEMDERIRRLDAKMRWVYAEQTVHFRYGVFPIPDRKEEVSRMINFANMAMDIHSDSVDCHIGYLDSKEREKMRWEKVLESEMEGALLNKEFEIYLQPKFYTDGSKVGGAEALVRWNSPNRGRIAPDDFIPLFEKNGFIMRLDDYMLEEMCKIQRKWLSEGYDLVTISVNVSRAHLMEANLVENIVAIVDRYYLPHSCIELELTESAFFDDKQVIVNTIRKMQAHGFKVSMDDFGAGYSSLNSLKDLPLDVIKLDAGFFRDASNSERGEKIIRNTIEMAKDLNMKIVAEGIEREDQVKFLNSIGCDLIQGYYFAKPMKIDEFEKLVYLKDAE